MAPPHHRDPRLRREAYWNLFLLEKDEPKSSLCAVEPTGSKLGPESSTGSGHPDVWAEQTVPPTVRIALAQHPEGLQEAAKILLEPWGRWRNSRTIRSCSGPS